MSDPDKALAEFMAPYTAKPTHFVLTKADLYAFAKTGGPMIPPAEIRSWRDGILNIVPSPPPRD